MTADQILTNAIQIASYPSYKHSPIRVEAGEVVASWYQETRPSEQELLYVVAALISQRLDSGCSPSNN